MTPAQLRRRIARDYRGRLKPRHRIQLLLRDDEQLMQMRAVVLETVRRGLPLSHAAAKLGKLCTYDQVKWLANILEVGDRKPKRHPPPPGGNGAYKAQRRDMLGHFVSDLECDELPLDREALRRRWLADGVDRKTVERWMAEAGATEGLG